MKHNELANAVSDLEQELLKLGEDKMYLCELKFAYVECYPTDSYNLMKHYYSHLQNIRRTKYDR